MVLLSLVLRCNSSPDSALGILAFFSSDIIVDYKCRYIVKYPETHDLAGQFENMATSKGKQDRGKGMYSV